MTSGRGVWDRLDQIPSFSPADDVHMHLLAGEKLAVNLVRMGPNSVVPIHAHANEQAGYIVRGLLIMTIDGETRDLTPGDTYIAMPDVPHGATSGPDGCDVIDIFCPPRQDYLDLAARARAESTSQNL